MGKNSAAAAWAPPAQDRDWELKAERGPDWLFVRLEAGPPAAGIETDLTESIWGMICEHHANRVVLEFEGVRQIDESVLGTIAEIGMRIRDAGGLVRICGLSQATLPRLQRGASPAAVPCFRTRSEAIGPRQCSGGQCE